MSRITSVLPSIEKEKDLAKKESREQEIAIAPRAHNAEAPSTTSGEVLPKPTAFLVTK